MTAPYGWGLVIAAIAATAVAIWAGANLALAIPAAVVAISAATLLIAEVALRAGAGRSTVAPGPASPQPAEVRTALVSGRLGRERLVLLLDTLELRASGVKRGPRPPEEIDRIAKMPAEEFRGYLQARVDGLEGRT
jgi:hypothetical protein